MPETTRRVRVVIDASGAEVGARRANTAFNSVGTTARGVGRTLGAFAAGFLSVQAAMDVGRAFINVNREFGKLNAMLVTATGSAEAAARQFTRIERFATQTPFGLGQAVDSFVKLKNLGLDPTERSLRSYGNTASAMGKNMNQMIEAVADAATGQFERLKEFGIKTSKEGEQVKFTFQGVTTAVQNSSTAIQEYLLKIGETEFAGSMDRQMNTLDGTISNLQDSVGGLLRQFGEMGASNGAQTLLRGITTEIEGLTSSLAGLSRTWNESGSSPFLMAFLFGGQSSRRLGAELRASATASGRVSFLQGQLQARQTEFAAAKGTSGRDMLARGISRFRIGRAQDSLAIATRNMKLAAANPDSLISELQPKPKATIAKETADTNKLHAAQKQVNAAEEKRKSLLERELELLARQGEHARDMAAIIERLNGGFAADFDRKLQSLRDRRLTPFSSIFDAASKEELSGLVNHDALRRAGLDVANDNMPRGMQNTGALQMQALGQIIGGGAGRGISQAAGVLQGISSGNFTGVGGSLGGILTLASTLKPGSGGIRDLVSDAFRKPVKSFDEAGDILKDTFSSGGGFEKTMGKLAGGAATGAAVAGIGNALGIEMSQTGAQIGGAIGSFIPIPGGSIIGSIAGGLIAKLFGKTPRAYSNLQVGADGKIAISSGGSKGSNSAENMAAAAQAADAVAGNLSSVLEAIGGSLRPGSVIGSIGPIGKQFGYATSLTSGGSNKAMVKFDTAGEAMDGLLKSVFQRNLVEGLDGFIARVLNAPGHSLDEAVNLASRYKSALDLMAESADPIEAAARKAVGAFDDLMRDMLKFGATSDELGKIEDLRAKALKSSLEEQTAGLRAFQQMLSGEGSGVPVLEQLASAQARYGKMRDAIGTSAFDQGKFTDLGQQVFGLARQIYGTSTSEFQDIRQGLMGDTAGALGVTEAAFNSAAAESKAVVEELKNQTSVAMQNYQQLLQSNQYLAAIVAAAANGNGYFPMFTGVVNGALTGAR